MTMGRWKLIGLATAAAVLVSIILGVAIGVPVSKRNAESDLERATRILTESPLIDGHNDLPWQYFTNIKNQIDKVNLEDNIKDSWKNPPSKIPSQTDIPRLRQGRVGAQFWAAYVSCRTERRDAVRNTLQQIDIVKRFVKKYPQTFQFVRSAQEIRDAFKDGKIGSLIGVEGGHSIDSDLATLRMFYELGVRYMTITHSCNTPWADNWLVESGDHPSIANGLTEFGKNVIREMNRMGMLVDLSHVSFKTMTDTLDEAQAPVIYSHSSAYALCNSTRNVPDDILKRVKDNGGVVMVNFYTSYISCNQSYATLDQVADHIEYIRDTSSIDNVGIGADYDGVSYLPEGLEDVSTFPDLFAELVRRGWSDEDLKKLAGENLLRVLEKAEEFRDSQADAEPIDDWIEESDVKDYPCRSNFTQATGIEA